MPEKQEYKAYANQEGFFPTEANSPGGNNLVALLYNAWPRTEKCELSEYWSPRLELLQMSLVARVLICCRASGNERESSLLLITHVVSRKSFLSWSKALWTSLTNVYLMQHSVENWVQEALHPHCQPDGSVYTYETLHGIRFTTATQREVKNVVDYLSPSLQYMQLVN